MPDADPPGMDPAQFAQLVSSLTDEQLAAGLAANRDLLLEQVFAQMPRFARAEAIADAELVVEWRILTEHPARCDRWQLSLSRGMARVERDGAMEPSVAMTIAPSDFIRLVTGNADPGQLYLTGRLVIAGDLMAAALLQSYFDLPGSA